MAVKNIRVLVVDDSAVIREMLSDTMAQAEGIELAATVASGNEALARIDQLRPDVVTLDIQMPGMGGIETLDEILKRCPTPVIMVSSLAQRSAAITLQALDHGALDYVAKPDSSDSSLEEWGDALIRKIRTVACTDVRRVLHIRKERKQRIAAARQAAPATSQEKISEPSGAFRDCCVAIGISTGGPPALASLFASLNPPLPPIVIVQHMPEQFTGPFAARLDSISPLSVKEACSGDELRANLALVAPGGKHLQLRKKGSRVVVQIAGGEPVCGHKPSVDVMMRDVAKLFGKRCLGVIMTGMGQDGAEGCGAIRAAGGYVFGQDEASSDVYGMNKVAFTRGHVDRQFVLDDLCQLIPRQCRKMFRLEARVTAIASKR